MEQVEQRSVVIFFSDEDITPLEIVQQLREHYEEGALSQSQVCYWIKP
jgi:hypothetical protein